MSEHQDIGKIQQEKERWIKQCKVDKSPEIKTDLDIKVDAIYTPADVRADYLKDLGFSGEYPFTRGPYPEMSRHKPWRYSVFTGFNSPEDTNARWKFLYKSGQPAFSIVYDLPTHMGVDSDDPLGEDEVGRIGIPVTGLADMEILFADLPIGLVPFNSNMETLSAMIIAFYIAAAEKRGVKQVDMVGSISNDCLSTAAAKGTTVFPLKHGVRLACDLIEYCTRNMPKFYPNNLKGVNMSEGGADMAQEVGFTFANGACYIEETLKRGLKVDDFASKFSFFFSSMPHIFEEACKYRAARRLWAKLLKERYGAKNPASMAMRFTGFACPLALQFEEPELNLVRAAFAALACALGGAQAMPHPSYDEAYAIPTEKGQSLALGTQQILAEETYITKTVDPLGGSYYVEYLTDRIEEAIVKKMKEVEEKGGSIKAIESGFMQREILEHFCKEEAAIASGEKVIVRKNKYRVEGEVEAWERLVLHKPDLEAVGRHIERLRRTKRERDNSAVREALKALRKAADGGENLMPYLINAARVYASIGELTNTLKEVWGVYKEAIVT